MSNAANFNNPAPALNDTVLTTMTTPSKRKPHNHLAGYVCERKYSAGGHLVIWKAEDCGIDFGTDDLNSGKPCKWGITWEFADEGGVIVAGFTSLKLAREGLKRELESFDLAELVRNLGY